MHTYFIFQTYNLELGFCFCHYHFLQIKLGLWIDLTNTSRFYNKRQIEAEGCQYIKLKCRGHGETPSEDVAKAFFLICEEFISQHPLEIIGM